MSSFFIQLSRSVRAAELLAADALVIVGSAVVEHRGANTLLEPHRPAALP
jgi:hypothetical protein